MITTHDILETELRLNENDHSTGPLLKLVCIWVNKNPMVPIHIKTLAQKLGCGERTLYRAICNLREKGVIEQSFAPVVNENGKRCHVSRFFLNKLPE